MDLIVGIERDMIINVSICLFGFVGKLRLKRRQSKRNETIKVNFNDNYNSTKNEF